MRITIVQGAFLPVPPLMGGAVEKVWFDLGKEFARCGHRVTHISRCYGEFSKHETIVGVRYIRIPGFDTPRSLIILKLLDLIYSWRVLRILPKADTHLGAHKKIRSTLCACSALSQGPDKALSPR